MHTEAAEDAAKLKGGSTKKAIGLEQEATDVASKARSTKAKTRRTQRTAKRSASIPKVIAPKTRCTKAKKGGSSSKRKRSGKEENEGPTTSEDDAESADDDQMEPPFDGALDIVEPMHVEEPVPVDDDDLPPMGNPLDDSGSEREEHDESGSEYVPNESQGMWLDHCSLTHLLDQTLSTQTGVTLSWPFRETRWKRWSPIQIALS